MEALKDLIDKKMKGRRIVAPSEEHEARTRVTDLMSALKKVADLVAFHDVGALSPSSAPSALGPPLPARAADAMAAPAIAARMAIASAGPACPASAAILPRRAAHTKAALPPRRRPCSWRRQEHRSPQEAPPTAEKQTLAVNPVVTQATLQSTVCIRGWTATVRPSFFASQRIKLEKMKALGATETTAYELDHIIPLCAGGSPDDPSNLQLQPWAEATRKDRLEAQACRCLCKGKISLAEVQADFRGDWKVAYAKYAKMVCR